MNTVLILLINPTAMALTLSDAANVTTIKTKAITAAAAYFLKPV